jgi:tRNA A37 threonylcarbamoyladenosine dehydratase
MAAPSSANQLIHLSALVGISQAFKQTTTNMKQSILALPRTLMKLFLQIIMNQNVRVAGASSLATILLVLAYLRLKKEDQVRRLRSDLSLEMDKTQKVEHQELKMLLAKSSSLPPNGLSKQLTQVSSTGSFGALESLYQKVTTERSIPDELIREQLSRHYSFLGEEGMQKLRHSFVIVVGLGGVGSHAAHMLARSGVGRLRLVDFDQVTLSSLNRHAVATLQDVGSSKAACLKQHLQEIVPFCKIESCVELFTKASADRLLGDTPDYVLDCIDNLDTKLDLLNHCFVNKIPILASMGAGTKFDPSRIQLADISNTYEDPLARTVRRRLKREYGIESGITVVYSTEKPHKIRLLPLEEEKVSKADEFATLPEFRARILPVLGTLPAIFGQVMASYVITSIAEFPMEPLPIKQQSSTVSRVYSDLCVRDMQTYGNRPPCSFVSEADVKFLIEEIYRGSSVLSGQNDRPALVRWNKLGKTVLDNLVLMTKSEAKAHDELQGDVEGYGKPVCDLVQRRLEETRECNQWRT